MSDTSNRMIMIRYVKGLPYVWDDDERFWQEIAAADAEALIMDGLATMVLPKTRK